MTRLKIFGMTRATHTEIFVHEQAADDPHMVNEVFVQMGMSYESAQTDFLRALSNFDVSSSCKRACSSRHVDEDESDSQPRPARLPKLKLPTFSGRYEDWEDFCDLFASLLHDFPRLANVTKLLYLKSRLTGTAADLVKE